MTQPPLYSDALNSSKVARADSPTPPGYYSDRTMSVFVITKSTPETNTTRESPAASNNIISSNSATNNNATTTTSL
jgi:hypothetical protein